MLDSAPVTRVTGVIADSPFDTLAPHLASLAHNASARVRPGENLAAGRVRPGGRVKLIPMRSMDCGGDGAGVEEGARERVVWRGDFAVSEKAWQGRCV